MKKDYFFILLVCLIFIFALSCEKKPTVLTIWQTETDPSTKKVLLEIASEFEKYHSDVRVEIESIAWGSLATNLQNALNANNPPDISHLQPFMLYSLYSKNLLEPITQVIAEIEKKNEIYDFIKDLHKINGEYYGIAHSFNVAQWGVRTDMLGEWVKYPRTWLEFVSELKNLTKNNKYGAILPGGDPLFIEFLLAQFVACNGGSLFKDGNPNFTDKSVLETLEFFKDISRYCPPDWSSIKYLDQFRFSIEKKVVFIPFTGVRASKQYENDALKEYNNEKIFSIIEPPIGPSGKISYSSFDGEPFVIFKKSKNKQLAKEFLIFFYKTNNYLKYCETVPIHLSPIFVNINEGDEYSNLDFVKRWSSWREMINKKIRSKEVLPFFISQKDEMNIDYLFDIQAQKILSDMVFDVTIKNIKPFDAARDAENKVRIIMNNRYKK